MVIKAFRFITVAGEYFLGIVMWLCGIGVMLNNVDILEIAFVMAINLAIVFYYDEEPTNTLDH